MIRHEIAVDTRNRQSLTLYLVFDKYDTVVKLSWEHAVDDHVPPMQHVTGIVQSVRQ